MKKQINEIKRMQQLAGLINESQLNEAKGQEVADFLNTHYDEVFEKIIKPAINYQGEMPEKFLNPELFDRWRVAVTMEEDDLSHCAELAIDDKNLPGIGFMATFEPFTEEDSDVLDMSDDVLNKTNNSPFIIAGRKIYMHEYDY